MYFSKMQSLISNYITEQAILQKKFPLKICDQVVVLGCITSRNIKFWEHGKKRAAS